MFSLDNVNENVRKSGRPL